MEENNLQGTPLSENDEQSSFNYRELYTLVVLHWQWFVLSIVVCLGIAFVYLRYSTPIYQAQAKLLIKDDDENNYRSSRKYLSNISNLGFMTNSTGLDNEMEILKSSTISKYGMQNDESIKTKNRKG